MHVVIIRRFLALIPVLIGISMIVFLMMYITPGDPAEIMGGPTASASDIEALRIKLGLNDPLYLQYWHFFKGLLQGDFGYSIQTSQPVLAAIMVRLPNTAKLAFGSMVIAVIIGLTAGIIAAVKQNSWFDHFSMIGSLAGVSIPSFWLGTMLILFFAVKLRWFPVGGLAAPLFSIEGIKQLFLPALALGTGSAAMIARMTRASVLEVIGQDYIRTARAKGVKEKIVILVHALRNAMIPVITVIGLNFGFLLGGAIITEQVFAINGIGRLMIQAISARDFPMVQGTVIFIATIFVLVNLVVDILYTLLDPRISYTK